MGKIIILDENTANKIAAGEVIERPASVIKELVENSIDAGANSISVEIRNGGISLIRVIDNGSGLTEDDVEIAFERHATSKIRRADDLESINSMGFRGEALASIAAVSDVQLATRVKSSFQGVSIKVKGGNVLDVKPIGCPVGTSITVSELFFNTPARYKFLKKDSTEAGYTVDMLTRIALCYPDISFKLINNGLKVLHTPGNGDLKSTIFSVYGAAVAKQLMEVNYQDEVAKIKGFIGKAEIARSNRSHQSIYINRRYIRNKTITAAIDSAYSTFLMKNKHPFVILDIRLNPASVDVNVHPSKMEVKFSNEQEIFRAVYHAINGTLMTQSTIRTLPDSPVNKYYSNNDQGSSSYSQKPLQGASRYPSSKTSSTNSYMLNDSMASKPAYSQQEFMRVKEELDKKREEAISGHPAQGEAAYTAQEAVNLAQSEAAYTAQEDDSLVPSTSLFNGARIIGQAFSTYVFLEGDDEMFLLDQHAAHERICYEELKEAFAKDKPLSQMLISVVPIELTASEYQFAISEASFFEKLGFSYEAFGANSIIMRAVPFAQREVDVGKLFLEILDFVMDGGNGEKSVLADEALYTIACKSAIKANKRLDEREVSALLDKLSTLKNPYTCPHGRPAILRLRRYELEKLFKRIV
ncbi:MAG: DNA mismatch repair endonuclease MutL [Clostridiaceae bacterium]|nr:DNA mismatch repair endonuclease MutL [Clostridiaceae bacterium]